jgi:hypothetical protein
MFHVPVLVLAQVVHCPPYLILPLFLVSIFLFFSSAQELITVFELACTLVLIYC